MKIKSLNLAVATVLAMNTSALIPPKAVAATMLEEVVVTARKREESMQETPVAVTAYSGEALEKMGVVDFRGLAMSNPNVKIVQSGGSPVITSTIAIRGNLQSAGTIQVDPAVGTYVDGHLIAQTIGTEGTSLDVESVQTLKGPQGTLFGRNTTGGAILIKTVDPDPDAGISGYLTGELGEIGTEKYTAAINLPFTDNIALRIAGTQASYDNYLTVNPTTITIGSLSGNSYPGAELGYRESEAYRAKLLWNATEDTSVLVNVERTKVEGTGTVNIAQQPNNARFSIPGSSNGIFPTLSPATKNDLNEADTKTYSLTITHELENGEVKYLAGRREMDAINRVSLPPLYGGSLQGKPDNEQTHFEVQYNATFLNSALDVTSGIYYFDSTIHEDQLTYFYAGPIASQSFLTVDSQSQSLYGQGTYHINDAWNLTLGGRFTQDEKEGYGEVRKSGVMTPLADYDSDISKFNYLVTIDYSPTDGLMFYGSTSTGYRAGGPGTAESAAFPGTWGEFVSEEITNFELGSKLDLFDNQLRVNLAVFQQGYDQYQYTKIIPVPGSSAVVRGVGNTDADITGGEMELTALLPADVTARLTYGYTKAEIDGGSDDGEPLPGIPESDYSVTLSKAFSLETGELDLLVNYSWVDSHFSEIASQKESTIDDHGLLNLSATYTHGDWKVAAYVNNATDEEYYTVITYAGGGAINFTGLGLPRVAGVRASFNF